MEIYEWKNKRITESDLFVHFDEEERQELKKLFPEIEKACVKGEGYYGFVNTVKKTFIPMRSLHLAFSGLYNAYPPYGKALEGISIDFTELTWQPYTEFEERCTDKD